MNIETVNIKILRPYWRNPRRMDDAVEALVKSIEESGYISPIAVDENYMIVAGHARYRALQRLDYTEIPVIVLDLPPDKIKEYRIADNKVAELAEWDDDKLLQEILKIDDRVFAETYFDDAEVIEMLGEAEEVEHEQPDSGFVAERKRLEKQVTGSQTETYVVMCPECAHEQTVEL